MPAKKDSKAEPKPRQVYCANPACFTTLRRLPLREGSSHTVSVRREKKTYHFCSQFCRDQAGENLEKLLELDKVAAVKRPEVPSEEPKAPQKKKASDEEEGDGSPQKDKPPSDEEEE